MKRWQTTVLNGLIISLGSFYMLFISDSFVAPFQSFLMAISVIMGSWGAIEMVDLIRQKRLNWDVDMAQPYGEGGRNYRWTALLSLAVSSFIGLGTVTSSDPYIGMAVSFLLPEGSESSMFVTANMGLALAMTVAAALYALLTFVLKCEVAPVKR